jgi:hypothetical protein
MKLLKKLREVQWEVPRGFDVQEVSLLTPEAKNRDLPAQPAQVRRLIAVAPFVNGTTLKRLGKWGNNAKRTLVSSTSELERVASGKTRPIAGFAEVKQLALTPDEGQPAQEDDATAGVEVHRGLHAKFLWVEHSHGTTLWLGSPNLTERAWKQNTEIYARVAIESRGSSKLVAAAKEGLEAFLLQTSKFNLSRLKNKSKKDDPLDEAHNEVSAYLRKAKQTQSDNGATIDVTVEKPPHPERPDIILKVGPVTDAPDQMVEWKRHSRNVRFYPRYPESASHLLRVALEFGSESRAWLMDIPIEGMEMDKRDSLLFGQYLDDDNLLAWIRQSLTGGPGGAEGGPWPDGKRQPPIRRKGRRRHDNAPTIEDVLRGWLRNRMVFAEIEEIFEIHDTRPDKINSASAMSSFKESVQKIMASLGEGKAP